MSWKAEGVGWFFAISGAVSAGLGYTEGYMFFVAVGIGAIYFGGLIHGAESA